MVCKTGDSVFFTIENKTSNALQFAEMRIGDGMLAYALRPENKGKEVRYFCVRGAVWQITFLGVVLPVLCIGRIKKSVNSELEQNGFCQS